MVDSEPLEEAEAKATVGGLSLSVIVAVWVVIPEAVALVGVPMVTITVSLSSSFVSGR